MRALGQIAVADLAAAGEKTHAGLPDAEGGEVVMQHELLELHPLDVVHALLVAWTCPRVDSDQSLGLTAGEQGTAVGAGKKADFTGDRADCCHVATVDTHLVLVTICRTTRFSTLPRMVPISPSRPAYSTAERLLDDFGFYLRNSSVTLLFGADFYRFQDFCATASGLTCSSRSGSIAGETNSRLLLPTSCRSLICISISGCSACDRRRLLRAFPFRRGIRLPLQPSSPHRGSRRR